MERTRELLGLADPDLLVDLLTAVTSGDAATTLARLQAFYDAGGDLRQLVRGLMQAIREAALRSVGYRQEESFGGSVGQRLEKIGRTTGGSNLLQLWKGLMEMEPELRKGADARLLLELTLLQHMEPASTGRMATAAAVAVPLPVSVPAAGPVPAVAPASASASVPAPAASADGGWAVGPGAPPAVNQPVAGGSDLRWEAMKQKLRLPVASLLKDARLARADQGVVRIEFRYPGHLELMQTPEKKEMLTAAIREVFGGDVRVELATGEGQPAGSPPAAQPPARRPVAEDPIVKDAMNRFDPVSVRVVPRGR